MDTTAEILEYKIDFNARKTILTIVLDTDDIEAIDRLKNQGKLDMSLNKHSEKRSLDANSYCWVLCDKIAKELSKDGPVITKEMVYKDSIHQVGTFEPMIIRLKAYENFKRVWQSQGIGFLVHEVARQDKKIKVHAYYGSHTYSKNEMSILINLLVEVAKSYEIETKTEREINSLLEQWDKMK